jgi:prepilin signal peptidase PulO-like enzyme (type II secretory pathway)
MLSVVLVAVVFGLIFGSAINALVWRLYVGRSWTKGRSVCPDCDHVLSAADLVPVVSWLMLGGKCRYCRKPIKDHPLVELATAAVFGLSAYAFFASSSAVSVTQILFWIVILVMLMVLAVYDLRWMILPDKVVLPLIVVSFIYAAVMAVMGHDPRLLADHLLAATLAGGSFYALVFFSKGRAMGGGDIKLAFAMGLILGIRAMLLALFLAFTIGAIIGIGLILSHRKGKKDQIPFGPFLVLATIIAYLFGLQIIGFYLSFSGLS